MLSCQPPLLFPFSSYFEFDYPYSFIDLFHLSIFLLCAVIEASDISRTLETKFESTRLLVSGKIGNNSVKMFKNVTIHCEIPKKPLGKMDYGCIETKYGQMTMGYSLQDDGILHIAYLHFSEGRPIEQIATDMQKLWPTVDLQEDSEKAQRFFETYFQKQKPKREVYVVLTGSKFQNKVWSALLRIPYGEERTYNEVAAMIKRPKSVRAVATAVAKNNIAIFIPCHRVKAKNNDMHKYRWGNELKKTILADEKSKN